MRLNELAKAMRTAGDESRLRILCVLFGPNKPCVGDVADRLGMSMASASHHLRAMSRDGLVVAVREGKRICYALPESPFVKDLKRFICKQVKHY